MLLQRGWRKCEENPTIWNILLLTAVPFRMLNELFLHQAHLSDPTGYKKTELPHWGPLSNVKIFLRNLSSNETFVLKNEIEFEQKNGSESFTLWLQFDRWKEFAAQCVSKLR